MGKRMYRVFELSSGAQRGGDPPRARTQIHTRAGKGLTMPPSGLLSHTVDTTMKKRWRDRERSAKEAIFTAALHRPHVIKFDDQPEDLIEKSFVPVYDPFATRLQDFSETQSDGTALGECILFFIVQIIDFIFSSHYFRLRFYNTNF